MQTRFSTRDRQRVAYDLAGPEDGPAVVLLHDLLGQRASMAPLRDRLAGHARCISIDLRGHGASATISGASIGLRELALDVAAVLDQEEIASAVLVGHGLGGAVSSRLAVERPAVVRSMVRIVPPELALDGSSLTEGDRRAADLAYKGVVDAALHAYLAPRLGPAWRDDLPRPTLAAARRHAPALATLLPALATTGDVRGEPDSLGIPTTAVDAASPHLDLPPATVDAAVASILTLLALPAAPPPPALPVGEPF